MPIEFKFCTKHGSDTAMLCAKFQNDWGTEMDVMDEQDFVRFDFEMSFRGLSYILQQSPGRILSSWALSQYKDVVLPV